MWVGANSKERKMIVAMNEPMKDIIFVVAVGRGLCEFKVVQDEVTIFDNIMTDLLLVDIGGEDKGSHFPAVPECEALDALYGRWYKQGP